MQPAAVFKCLGDETRLRTLLLLLAEGELCVCEIAAGLDLSQPKVSRHLAQLRNASLLRDNRQGQWIFYQLHPQLPDWVREVLVSARGAQNAQLATDQQRLMQMGERPDRQALCC